MDKSSIGINAGRVWQKLSESNKRWEYEELKHALDLADRDLNAAIGWLAREDKLPGNQLLYRIKGSINRIKMPD